MSFATAHKDGLDAIGSGEDYSQKTNSLSFATFEDGLLVGRFAKIDGGSVDNIDASASPVIAGVVLRNVTGAIEDGGGLGAEHNTHVELAESGYVSVDVVAADTPSYKAKVFVKNVAGADAGKATTVNGGTTEDANAVFIEEIQAGVWKIRLI